MFKVKSKLFSKKSDSSSKAADQKGENGEKPNNKEEQINHKDNGHKEEDNADAPAADPIPTGLCKKLGSYFNDNPLNGIAAKRLMKEYEHCMKMSSGPEAPFTVELIDNALNKWNVQLRHIDKESKLYKDMSLLNS